MDAALVLLRTTSPQELTVVQIAKAAQVDPALVRYYFDDKAGVLHAAAKKLLDEVQERSGEVLSQKGPLKRLVRQRLELLMDALRSNPRLVELVLDEIYGKATRSQQDREDLEAVARRGLLLTQSLLENAQARTALRAGVEPRFLHIAILGVCTFYVDAEPLLRAMFGDDNDPGTLQEQYLDFATELLARGLRK